MYITLVSVDGSFVLGSDSGWADEGTGHWVAGRGHGRSEASVRNQIASQLQQGFSIDLAELGGSEVDHFLSEMD